MAGLWRGVSGVRVERERDREGGRERERQGRGALGVTSSR